MRVVISADPFHGDAVFNRTHKPAQITANAFVLVDPRDSEDRRLRGIDGLRIRRRYDAGPSGVNKFLRLPGPVQVDALMRTVPTRDVAEVAADAFLRMYACHDLIVQVEIFPIHHLRDAAAAEIVDGSKALLIHPLAQTVDHVFHHAIPVMHGRRADLDGAASQQEELRGIAPGGDTADT